MEIILYSIIGVLSLLVFILVTSLVVVIKQRNKNIKNVITYNNKKDIILSAGETYKVGVHDFIKPRQYTILGVDESENTFKIRVNNIVRSYQAKSQIVLTANDTISPRSCNIILR